MTEKDLKNYICLLSLPNIGNVTAKTLISYCGSVEGVFNASERSLRKIPGIGQLNVAAILQNQPYMIKAEAELEASIKLTQGAKEMERSPIALELRRMQMLSEIGIDNNTTTVIVVPSDITNAARSFTDFVDKKV